MSKGLTQANVNSQALGTSNEIVGGSSESASAGIPLGSAGGRIPGVGDWMQLLPLSSASSKSVAPFAVKRVSNTDGTYQYWMYLLPGSFTMDGEVYPKSWNDVAMVGDDKGGGWYELDGVDSGSSIFLVVCRDLSDDNSDYEFRFENSDPGDEEDLVFKFHIADVTREGVKQQTCGPIHLIRAVADVKSLGFYSRKRLEDDSAEYADQVNETLEDTQMFMALRGFYHAWGLPDWFNDKYEGDYYYKDLFDDDDGAQFVTRFVDPADGTVSLHYFPLNVVFLYFMHALAARLEDISVSGDIDANSDTIMQGLASQIVKATTNYLYNKIPCLEDLCETLEDLRDNTGGGGGGGGGEDEDGGGGSITFSSGPDSRIMFSLHGSEPSSSVTVDTSQSSEIAVDVYYV